ncbi:uncharacterized protein VTP21DRAFT_1524 [Calcarisporiella thermophila]|uniref:uncharacterized protein n=1 Tax=Calcarisporiella thermophila TaxID=911321 RepID=UPI003744384F
MALQLTLFPETFTVVRYPANYALDSKLLEKCSFYSITRTPSELSLLILDDVLPSLPGSQDRKVEQGFRGFKIAMGQLDFSLVGILAKVVEPLRDARVPLFVISTFDTDYVLVKNENVTKAREVLTKAGHKIDDGELA